MTPDLGTQVGQPAGMGKEPGIFLEYLEIPVEAESQNTVKNKVQKETDYHFLA